MLLLVRPLLHPPHPLSWYKRTPASVPRNLTSVPVPLSQYKCTSLSTTHALLVQTSVCSLYRTSRSKCVGPWAGYYLVLQPHSLPPPLPPWRLPVRSGTDLGSRSVPDIA
eukprot:381922-Rhodomonas_salina.1